MRKNIAKQLPIVPNRIEHEHADELRSMSELLDAIPQVYAMVGRDLLEGRSSTTGRPGMTGEQALRVLVIKQMTGLSYERLAFHLADSASYRAFCRIGTYETPPSRSRLQANLKKIRSQTLEGINRLLVRHTMKLGLEDGRMVRIDSTVVEANIHHPTDSSLLADAVRMLSGMLRRVGEHCDIQFSDHTKRAKKRAFNITNAKTAKQRQSHYRDLTKVAGWTLRYCREALRQLQRMRRESVLKLRLELQQMMALAERVLDQTQRRVFQSESVYSGDKVVSLTQPHTDVIVKGGRDTEYGHKVFLTVGHTGMVLDMTVERGNPADVTRVRPLLQRHRDNYGEVPERACFDAGFTSNETLDVARDLGVADAAFAKRSGVDVMRVVRSSWVYKQLMRARAGVEGIISFLKRCFGFDRCTWSGMSSFESYAWASALAANLLIAARLALS